MERAALRPAAPRRQRRDVSSFGYFEKEDAHAAVALARAPVRGARSSSGASRWARPPPRSPPRTTRTVAGLGLRQHLPEPAGHRWPITWSWPGRGRGGCASCRAGPWGPRSCSGSAGKGGFDVDAVDSPRAAARLAGAALACSCCNSGDERMPFRDRLRAEGRGRGPGQASWSFRATATAGRTADATAAYQSAVAQVLDESVRLLCGVAAASTEEESDERAEEAPGAVPRGRQRRGRSRRSRPGSYTMVDPRFRRDLLPVLQGDRTSPRCLDRKTKELIAIAASLAAKCQGCLEGHIRKA
jgi:hypothetical protein